MKQLTALASLLLFAACGSSGGSAAIPRSPVVVVEPTLLPSGPPPAVPEEVEEEPVDHRDAGPPIEQADGAGGLKAFFEALLAAVAQEDPEGAFQLAKSAFPDETAARKALRDDVDDTALEKILARFARLPSEPTSVRAFAPHERTEIHVHAATTEELIAYEKGTTAYEEFPGGAHRIASESLRPGVTFYEVELRRPGAKDGTRIHLFFWDGSRWRILGPIWRDLAR